jgi:hypothetical protein
MPHQVDRGLLRHVPYRAVPGANRIPAPSSRAYQPKPTRVEEADIVLQSSDFLARNKAFRLSFSMCRPFGQMTAECQKMSHPLHLSG